MEHGLKLDLIDLPSLISVEEDGTWTEIRLD